MPPALSQVHSRFETPYRSIALTALLVVSFVLIGDIETLAKAGSVLHLIVYGLLNLSLIVYRESGIESYTPTFETPAYPYVPILGALFSFGLIGFMAPLDVLLSLAFVTFGAFWYLGYARHHTEDRGVVAELFDSDR